ncbi:MAG TPA: pyrimidine reductase family protein [Acidimicrobiales bacterium]|nr:pyrimidine reductase family protein [Acidimicrobiales bacterium]
MRQLLPVEVADVDPVTSYLAAERPAPADRPWVVVGMVSSLDGATAVAGRSGALGGPADRVVFRAVRAIADVILVAAGTVRTERYGPVRLGDEALAARAAAGRTALPRLAVVTASLEVDLEALAVDGARPVVYTTIDVDPDRRAAAEDVADVRVAGTGQVDVRRALADLRADGADVVVCEGGPRLNGALVDADVVDEWCVTLAPVVAGGDSSRLVVGAAPLTPPRPLALAQLLSADGVLFGRWVRA